MNLFGRFLRRPQGVWLRQANFQVHLWVGIILALYMILIGVTGSILVLREELETLSGLRPWHDLQVTGPSADIVNVIQNIRTAYPRARLISVLAPTETDPIFVAHIQGGGRGPGALNVAAHPTTGQILGPLPRRRSWISVLRDLHITLLIGITGRQTNGVLAGFLLLLNITGMVVWWPGLKSWTRALTVDFRRTWRRVNFDLHRAVGFWTLGIVTLWAISGVYFGFPSQTFAFINRLSPIVTARPPLLGVPPQNNVVPPDLHALIAQAQLLDPGTTLKGIGFPGNRRAPLQIYMRRGKGIGFEYADTLYFNPYDGTYLTTWKYGVNQSLGDWFIWSQIPLHFGTFWGWGVKILWVLMGLSIPLLTVTGALMYWNRYLRRKWKHLRGRSVDRQHPQVGVAS
jgi:uncharacterized iron-regulated membrane protein